MVRSDRVAYRRDAFHQRIVVVGALLVCVITGISANSDSRLTSTRTHASHAEGRRPALPVADDARPSADAVSDSADGRANDVPAAAPRAARARRGLPPRPLHASTVQRMRMPILRI